MALLVLVPYFSHGDPPGVDAPTFLHFGWVFQQSLLGSGGSFFNDPWWYGGLPYLQAYSPGGYGAVGLLAAITPFELATAFKLIMAVALAGTALATYWLGRTLGLRSTYAFLAGALLALSYPVIAGIGIFGWLPTLVSMPLAMAAYVYTEKWTAQQTRRNSLLAGALLGAALLAHHMTSIALGLAILVRLVVYATDTPGGWRSASRSFAVITGATVTVSLWWAVPFLTNTVSVGFQRELPGNWEFGASTFVASVFDSGRIGVETYPSYIGLAQGALGIAGAIYAIVYRSRFRGLAIAAAVLFWFAMGAGANPLIRVYPLSGLDVSRFAFYVAPLLALLAASVVQKAAQTGRATGTRAVPVLLVLLTLAIPIADAVAARDVLDPVEEPRSVSESMTWLEENIPDDSRILAVGYRNWDGYWIPRRAGIPIMDGWYDEGAENWRNVRDYRLMGWLRDADASRLHQIMGDEQTDYLIITQWDTTDSPDLFEDVVSERPDLFEVVAVLDDSVVYRRL